MDIAQPAAARETGAPDPAAAEPWQRRALAAAAGAAVTTWAGAHLLSSSPLAPAVLVLLAALLVVVLPRVGWVSIAFAITVGALIDGHAGGGVVFLLAALAPVLLMPRDGTAWPLVAGAPALGIVALAGAWPALAGRARDPWRRAALGAGGWVWLVLIAPIVGRGLYLHLPTGIAMSPGWMGSLHQTVEVVLRPLLTSGAFLGAPVWAGAAVVLPILVRSRSLALDFVMASTWAAFVVFASQAAISLADAGAALVGGLTAVIGAVASVVIALAPWLTSSALIRPKEAARTARGRPRLP
jgi:hypothetical protein